MQISRLGGVSEDLTPCGIASLSLDSNDFADLIELIVNVQVVNRFVFKTSEDLSSFFDAAVFCEPARGLRQKWSETKDKSGE